MKKSLPNNAVLGFEYISEASFCGLPLVHICTGVDAVTMKPRIAKGILAIGNVSIGVISIGGFALGIFSFGGMSIGALAAIGGAALGFGVSFGGLAVGSVAFGGLAVGLKYAFGGAAFGNYVISGEKCDVQAFEFLKQWIGSNSFFPRCKF